MLEDSAAPATHRAQRTPWRLPHGAPPGPSVAARPDAPARRTQARTPQPAPPARPLPTRLILAWALLVILALGAAGLAARGSVGVRALVVVGVIAAVVYVYLALRRT
jgi:hypothetical protein